jgi:hypothetical protein
MPSGSDGFLDMFATFPEWNLTFFLNWCSNYFKKEDNIDLFSKPYWITNVYGAKNIGTASKIIFSNSQFDPWVKTFNFFYIFFFNFLGKWRF